MNVFSHITFSRLHSLTLYTPLAVLFSLLWASAFIAVKFALRSSPPLFLMGFRFLLAGMILLVIAWLRGQAFPNSRRDWLRLAVLGLLNNAAYLGLSAVALRHLSGGMGAVLASTTPLMLAAIAPLVLKERLGLAKVLGLLLAFVSVVTIMYSRLGIGDAPSSMLLVLLANAFLVTGTVLFKRWAPRYDLVVITGIQLLVASIALLLPSFLSEPPAMIRWDLNFWAAIVYLALAVSCGATLIWLFLLRSGDASKASAFFFLNPVVGLFLGALFLGEPLRPVDFLGTAGVALGIYLVQRSRPMHEPLSAASDLRAETTIEQAVVYENDVRRH
jgi:drug/metabolite transporter (DMT)-like permease